MAPDARAASPGGTPERRLTAEYVAARVLIDATSFDEAAPKILEAICTTLGWEHGALWMVDREADTLRCDVMWTDRPDALGEFHAVSRRLTFAAGSACPAASGPPRSLPGFPTWPSDINFPRAAVAAREGLHAALRRSRCCCAAKCSA